MKKIKWLWLLLALPALFLLCACDESTPASDETPKTTTEEPEMNEPKPMIMPTVYDTDVIVTADKTKAGSLAAWQNEVFLDGGGNNDMETENAVIHSPFHTLTVDGIDVPVYTVRCGKGSHSFAWIDIREDVTDFALDVHLTLDESKEKCGGCVVLPESRGVTAEKQADGAFTATITDFGSHTFTFSRNADDEVTDPKRMPLTLMVTKEVPLTVPDGYAVKEIAPGYHDTEALELTDTHTVYVMKAGLHDIASIGLPSDSVLYIERGAYLQVTDRQYDDGSYATKTAIHADYASNVQIISRGLLDCGRVLGGPDKHKHVVNAGCSENVTIEGLTVVNANTWSMCFYNCENALAEWNMLLSYRTYSDGIMMSECRDSAGRYNFVRTGDDAIEFKGTGWWGSAVGENCVYEYNDLWTDKGAGYCLTWEAGCEMRNMVFRHNSVGFAQPTWTDRNTALDCLVGSNAETRWGDVVFEDIEIYHVISPNAINTQVTGAGAILDNITFRDIRVKSAEKNVVAYRMAFDAAGGSISNITLENIDFCGHVLTPEDKENKELVSNRAPKLFDAALTIK